MEVYCSIRVYLRCPSWTDDHVCAFSSLECAYAVWSALRVKKLETVTRGLNECVEFDPVVKLHNRKFRSRLHKPLL